MLEEKKKKRYRTKIKNPARMKQLIDFKGLQMEYGIFPTDIDGLVEFRDKAYLIFEVKFNGAPVPVGQRLALSRMVEDFTRAGKKAIAIVCDHFEKNTDKPVVAAECVVREIYLGTEHRWHEPEKSMTLRESVDLFLNA